MVAAKTACAATNLRSTETFCVSSAAAVPIGNAYRSDATVWCGRSARCGSDYPGGAQGSELVVEFTLLGQPFVGLNGGPNFSPNEAVSFQVTTDDQAETDRYWDAIVGNGGKESQRGWCKDRWGFSWQIVPRALMAAMSDPDRAAAKRAMDAMMTSRKIEI